MSDDVSDATLYDLTPIERRVVRLMAGGGWDTGNPSLKAVETCARALGLSFADEIVRGEPRAFWPANGESAAWQALAARLDALPRIALRAKDDRRPTAAFAAIQEGVRTSAIPRCRCCGERHAEPEVK